jgi:hypothetical protein
MPYMQVEKKKKKKKKKKKTGETCAWSAQSLA